MSRPEVPLLIASLPGRSLESARLESVRAAAAGADLAEIRFDRWPDTERPRAAELFPSPIPLVATLRSRAEGGEGPDSPSERSEWLRQMLQLPFAWVDLETARDAHAPERRPGSLVRFFLSAHLPEGAPLDVVRERLSVSRSDGSLAKVVVPSSIHRALGELVPLLSEPASHPRILLTTGPSGQLLRAWGRRLGVAAVFGALPPVAGGPAETVERAQLRIDRLRAYFAGEAIDPLFAVLGRPVFHSRSPDLHHLWMAAQHHPGLYLALEPASDTEFEEMLTPLAEGGFRGFNVTHPFKDTALRAATDPDPGAQECECANTLTFRGDHVDARNTDLVAVRRRMEELRKNGSWDGGDVLVLGAGGAARATLAAARDLGSRAMVLARSEGKARSICERFGARLATNSSAANTGLIINATTVGRGSQGDLDFSLKGWIGPGSYLLDFVYRPDSATLSDLARGSGAAYEEGGRLLAYAAASSYETWWGEAPGHELIERALREVA